MEAQTPAGRKQIRNRLPAAAKQSRDEGSGSGGGATRQYVQDLSCFRVWGRSWLDAGAAF